MKRALIATGKIFAFLGIWLIALGLCIVALIAQFGEDFADTLLPRVLLEAGSAAGLLIGLVIMARLVDKRGWNTLGFRWSAAPFGLIAGTLLGAAIFFVPIAILVALGAAHFSPDFAAFSASSLAMGLALCFVNVVDQEALVRSYMFQELWIKYGAWAASFITTALFLLMHAKALMQGVPGLFAGANILLASLMMSLAYVRTRALWLPIGIHFGWNGLQGPVLHVNVTGMDLGVGAWKVFDFPGDALLTGGSMGVEGGLVGLVGPVLGLLAVHVLVKQRPASEGIA